MQGVQRFLTNDKNWIREAAVVSAPVKTIEDAVVALPISRNGALSAALTGEYTGSEPSLYELEVVDLTATIPLETTPYFKGLGNGEMSAVATTGLTPRTVTVELTDLGELLTQASADLQNVRVVVKTPGAAGNKFYLRVDRSNLSFVPQAITLLTPIQEGTKSMTGPELDWDTVAITGDGLVPSAAHRIAFGEDYNNIYVQYKQFVDEQYTYFFEPPIKQHVPERTVVNFVTGTYEVKLYEDVVGVETLRETYSGIVTLYDLLNAIKMVSTRLLVVGNVVLDREPGGQALLELSIRTDSRYISNTGFKDIVIASNTPTELIEATCFAATPNEDERAGFGQELWSVRGSVSGLITPSVKTEELIQGPFFEAKIKSKLPVGLNEAANGRFGVEGFNMVSREDDELTPQICPVSLTLGINARETLLTLTYVARPTTEENCPCDTMNAPDLSDAECLGGDTKPTEEGGATVVYTDADTLSRLKDLYDYYADVVRDNTSYNVTGGSTLPVEDPFISNPNRYDFDYPFTPSVRLQSVIESFEKVLALIDPLTAGAAKTAGYTAWDTAFTEFQADVDAYISAGVTPDEVLPSYENLADGDAVTVFEVSAGVYKVRKAVPGGVRYGFVDAAVVAPANATVRYSGLNDAVSSTEATGTGAYLEWRPSIANPGKYVKMGTVAPDYTLALSIPNTSGYLTYVSATQGVAGTAGSSNPIAYKLLADRYYSRLKWVLSEAELSPLGKFNASPIEAGDSCWRDLGDDFYWQVVGTEGAYAPAFTNQIYYSARKGEDNVYRGTKEFGFQINVQCIENLKVGDSFTLVISNIPEREGWKKGDKVVLGILAQRDIAFEGGKDSTEEQTWYVTDSIAGPLDAYVVDTVTPAPYSDGGVEFLIEQGVLPFVKGDRFAFDVEGGRFRWRRDGGAWSAATSIDTTPVALDLGLSVEFVLGIAPAISVGDVFMFNSLQPYAIGNAGTPDFDAWNWGNVTIAVGVWDLGSAKNIEALVLAFHDLPSTAAVLVEGGTAPGVYTWAQEIEWVKDVMGVLLEAAQSSRYVRLIVTGAPEGSIGWFYVGETIKFTYSADVSISREYKMDRSGGGKDGVFMAVGNGSSVNWQEGHLLDEDYTKLVEMVDWVKRQDDETLMFFPQQTRNEIVVGKVDTDSVSINDVFNFQPNVDKTRRFSANIPLRAVHF